VKLKKEMIGKLHKTKSGWSVLYQPNLPDTTWTTISLHQDDWDDMFMYPDNYQEEIEFEIFQNEDGVRHARLIPFEGFVRDITNKVTRFEVIDHTPNGEGRVYVKRDLKEIEISYQDDGRTLKIFLK
jgi:hypothetical protein